MNIIGMFFIEVLAQRHLVHFGSLKHSVKTVVYSFSVKVIYKSKLPEKSNLSSPSTDSKIS
jgi:hypothetical protein